ncbi:hypothetical protein PG988_011792 [Apiospora saccharicola]
MGISRRAPGAGKEEIYNEEEDTINDDSVIPVDKRPDRVIQSFAFAFISFFYTYLLVLPTQQHIYPFSTMPVITPEMVARGLEVGHTLMKREVDHRAVEAFLVLLTTFGGVGGWMYYMIKH